MFKKIQLLVAMLGIMVVLTSTSFWSPNVKNAKVKDFKLCHSATTIKSSVQYTDLNKLTDDQLKKACTSPSNSDYVTVKMGTFDLRDGNTRVYILSQRGFTEFSIPYDEIDTGNVCDF